MVVPQGANNRHGTNPVTPGTNFVLNHTQREEFDFSRATGHSFSSTRSLRLLNELRDTPSGESSTTRERWVVAGVIIALTLFCAAVEASQNYLGALNFGKPVPFTESIRRTLPSWVINAFLAPGALYLGRRFPLDRGRWPVVLPIHLVGASLFAVAHLGGTAVYYAAIDGAFERVPVVLVKYLTVYFILDMLIYCGIVGASHAVRYYREAKSREVATVRLQESLTQARLAALRGQLNPHFLFNTLNAITTMALKREHDNVVVTLGYLSELLRVSLDDRLPQEVALADELELLERYLEIQRIRFGDRLTVTRDIDDDTLDALVPIMILQPLAENAIVHGIAPVTGPGELRLRATRSNGKLVLEVSDTGPGFSTKVPALRSVDDPKRPSGGIGLSNTRARLAQLYGDHATIEIGSGATGGARVTVIVPFRAANTASDESDVPLAAGAVT
jgi:signal transduction histidine kinase